MRRLWCIALINTFLKRFAQDDAAGWALAMAGKLKLEEERVGSVQAAFLIAVYSAAIQVTK